jgi:peptidyl-prolyl cis-trans isomerase SurA
MNRPYSNRTRALPGSLLATRLKVQRFMKILAVLLLTAGGFLLFSPNLSGEVVDRIAAVVNGDVITLSEVEQMGGPLFDQVRKTSTAAEQEEKLKKARVEILEHLIESKLLEGEMKKRKIEVPDRDVDAAINEVLKNSGFSESELRKVLAREGMTYAAYRQKVRDELGKMRLVSREIRSKIVIEEDELRKYYLQNQEKFTDPLEVKIQQIFFPLPPDAPKGEAAAVEDEARAVLEKARKGEDFTDLAKKYSKGPEADEGGLLGWFKHKELMPELEEPGFRLKIGEVSELIRSTAGFHIIRVLERKGGEPRPFAEVQYKIRDEMSRDEAEKKFQEWVKELRAKAYIEIKL